MRIQCEVVHNHKQARRKKLHSRLENTVGFWLLELGVGLIIPILNAQTHSPRNYIWMFDNICLYLWLCTQYTTIYKHKRDIMPFENSSSKDNYSFTIQYIQYKCSFMITYYFTLARTFLSMTIMPVLQTWINANLWNHEDRDFTYICHCQFNVKVSNLMGCFYNKYKELEAHGC